MVKSKSFFHTSGFQSKNNTNRGLGKRNPDIKIKRGMQAIFYKSFWDNFSLGKIFLKKLMIN
jgi:hypothetical protein